ncbi:G2:mitotic specific cyclin B3 [Echinococcus multilocularis]|uniref:G2:mitotic specific cyclin B3 n=1 Tax=Echinococcus multilocularis TaxID=6211 RepID=A0A068YEJ5_ECHMU|nr:G2:mitotic specific cyclin B3 [Echinococcus multilocularis]
MNLISDVKKDPICVEPHVAEMSLKGRPVLKLLSDKSNQALKKRHILDSPFFDKENAYCGGRPHNYSSELIFVGRKLSARTESESNRLDSSKCARGDADILKPKNSIPHSFTVSSSKSSFKVVPLNNKNGASSYSSSINSCNVSSSRQKPMIAFDVVRAIFAERSSLESIFSELRFSDHPCTEGCFPNMDYFLRIIAHERLQEDKACFQIRDFLSRQSHQITSDMLVTLADWMVEIQESFALSSSSLHLAWGLLYAFFDSAGRIQRTEVQLYASVAFVVACKLEELDSPEIEDFVYLTNNAYSHEQLVIAEQELLTSIDFKLHRPNPFFFLRYFYRVLDSQSAQLDCMCRFLLDVGLHDHEVSLARASKRAAAVLWLARCVLRNPSYALWRKLSQIAELYNLILSNERFSDFYASCGDSPRQNDNWSSEGYVSVATPFVPVRFLKSISEPLYSGEGVSKVREQQPREDQTCKCIRELREMEKQRCPLWPPLLQHVTGYAERELIPLALQHHRCALQLLAEAARGGRLQAEVGETEAEVKTERVEVEIKEEIEMAGQNSTRSTSSPQQSRLRLTASRSSSERTTSPGGHNIRRHVISKYYRTCYMSVAETYLRCSFKNLIPHFPELQCPDSCSCFVCMNLLSPKANPAQDVQAHLPFSEICILNLSVYLSTCTSTPHSFSFDAPLCRWLVFHQDEE